MPSLPSAQNVGDTHPADEADRSGVKMSTGSASGKGGFGVLKGGGGSVLKGGRSVLKDKWREQSAHTFSYDPFGPDSDWNIDFEEEDLSAISDATRRAGGADDRQDLPALLAREAHRLDEAAEKPPMCVAGALEVLSQRRREADGHAPVYTMPAGLSEEEAEFVRAHTCAFTLRCKRRRGDTMPMLIRPLCPSDRDALQRGLGWLSLRSQVMRFLSPMPRLSDHELSYLTQLDYRRHFAWCLASDTLGVAIGRYVCSLEDPTKAELALTVIDPLQGLGLSSLLTWAISHVAHKNGVRAFTGVYHKQNVPIHRMLGKMRDTGLQIDEAGDSKGMNSFEMSLPMPVPDVATVLLSSDDLLAFMHAVDGHATATQQT